MRADARYCCDAHRVSALRLRRRRTRRDAQRDALESRLFAFVANTPGLSVWELKEVVPDPSRDFDAALRNLHIADALACINGLWYVRTADVSEYETRFIEKRKREMRATRTLGSTAAY